MRSARNIIVGHLNYFFIRIEFLHETGYRTENFLWLLHILRNTGDYRRHYPVSFVHGQSSWSFSAENDFGASSMADLIYPSPYSCVAADQWAHLRPFVSGVAHLLISAPLPYTFQEFVIDLFVHIISAGEPHICPLFLN